MPVIGPVVEAVLFSFLACLWIRFVTDMVSMFARSWTPRGPLVVALEVVYSVTDPPIKLVRRFVPPLRIGTVAIDLGFLLVLLVAFVLLRVNQTLYFS